MPPEVKNLCRLADISSKSLLLQIVRLGDRAKMIAMIEKITRDGNATREKLRKEAAPSRSAGGREPTSSSTGPPRRRSTFI